MQQLLKDFFPIFFPKSFKRSLPNFGNWKQCKHASGSRNVSHGPVILDGNDKSQLDSPPFLRTSYGLDLTLGVQDLIPGHLKIGKNIIRKWWRVHADPIYREISIPIEAPKSQISLEPAIFAPRSLAFLFMKSSVCAQSFAGTGWQTELVGFWLKVVDAMHSESVFFLPRVTLIHYLPRRKGLCNEIQNKPRNMRVSCESWHPEYWSASNFKGGGIFPQHRGIAASKINALNFIKLLDMEELGDLEQHAEMPRKHAQPPTSCSSPCVLVENLP